MFGSDTQFYVCSYFLAPTEPRNLTCESVSPGEILIKWKRPEFIYGTIGTFEVIFVYYVGDRWVTRNKFLFKDDREWKLKAVPFTDYKIKVRESAGVKYKWGPFSQTCLLKTLEGGLFCY